MANQLLKDRAIYPSDEVLAGVLGGVWPVFEAFRRELAELGIEIEWRYYNDGKAWLGKTAYRKKTILWLSVWEGYFQTSFYFLDRHLEGLAALGLDDNNYTLANKWGGMIPLTFNISREAQLDDVMKVAAFKKTAK